MIHLLLTELLEIMEVRNVAQKALILGDKPMNTIDYKHAMGDKVFVMSDNRILELTIDNIAISIKDAYDDFDNNPIVHVLYNHVYDEDDIFTSKGDLMKHVMEDL